MGLVEVSKFNFMNQKIETCIPRVNLMDYIHLGVSSEPGPNIDNIFELRMDETFGDLGMGMSVSCIW